jgi:hypothetical protein
MNPRTRHDSQRCKASAQARHGSPYPLESDTRPGAQSSLRPGILLRSTSLKAVLTTSAASVTLVGPLSWDLTRNVALSLGTMFIFAAAFAIVIWLVAREETQQVKALERGATDREKIRHQGETLLAEAEHLLLRASTCGPSLSPADAQALRADARKALQLIQPTSVKDAMQVTRTTDNHGFSCEMTVQYRDRKSSPVPEIGETLPSRRPRQLSAEAAGEQGQASA